MPLGQIETLKANPNLLIETHGYDYQPIVYRLEFNLANPYFAKPEVRRAVAHAVDRDAINRIVFYGWTQSAPAAISDPPSRPGRSRGRDTGIRTSGSSRAPAGRGCSHSTSGTDRS